MTNPKAKGKGKAAQWLRDHVGYTGNDCLAWPFSKDSRVGRGRVVFEGKPGWAHRYMCEWAHGPPPTPKHQAAHNCGNGHKGCVNPQHLEWKTMQENSVDRVLHGRKSNAWWGTRGKLTAEQIAGIRSLKGRKTQVAIAKQFGVSLSCVQYWQHGRERWPSHAKTR